MSTSPLKNASPLSIMFPGRKVTIVSDVEGVPAIDVIVRPLSVRQMRDFQGAISALIGELIRAGRAYWQTHPIEWQVVPSDEPGGQAIERPSDKWITGLLLETAPSLLPVLVDEAVNLIAGSVSGIDLMDEHCPCEVLAQVAEAWLLESFGSEKRIRPWIAAAKTTFAALMSNKSSISAMQSIFSSATGTTPGTSSSDGPFPSSGSTSNEPSTSSENEPPENGS